ncbi:unnamed protein product, partial [Meganyctiphanes norvegica]
MDEEGEMVSSIYRGGGSDRIRGEDEEGKIRGSKLRSICSDVSIFDPPPVKVTGCALILCFGQISYFPFEFVHYGQNISLWHLHIGRWHPNLQELSQRATVASAKVMIFPEGTCTNRTCLITFKAGAFYPGVPIQPVVIRYPNRTDTVTWTWDGPGAFQITLRDFCEIYHMCELDFFPVCEKVNNKLYTDSVLKFLIEILGSTVAAPCYYTNKFKNNAKGKSLVSYNHPFCNSQKDVKCKARLRTGLNYKESLEDAMKHFINEDLVDYDLNIAGFEPNIFLSDHHVAGSTTLKLYSEENSGSVAKSFIQINGSDYIKPINRKTQEAIEKIYKKYDGGRGPLRSCDILNMLMEATKTDVNTAAPNCNR